MDELRAEIARGLAAVLSHRWVALGVAWLVCATAWFGTAAIPNQYRANARVYVDADAVLTPLLRGLALDNSLAAQIEVLQRTLLSRPNLEKLISKTDLSLSIRTPGDEQRLVDKLSHQIEVVPQTNQLFTITYRNRDPQLAYDVVRTILGIFVEDKAGTSRTDMANANAFLNDQIASYEQQLRDAEASRAAFRAKYVDLLPSDGSGGASRLDQAEGDLARLTGELADATSRQSLLVARLATTAPTVVTETDPGSPGGGGGGGLASAEAKLRELRATLTDRHPEVIAQEQLIETLRHGGASSEGGGARPARSRSEPSVVYQQLEVMRVQADSDVASLTRRVAAARADVARLEQIARDVPTVQAQSVNLNRDYDVLRKNYEELLARREAMRLADAADTRADKIKLEVVDPPQVPRDPVSPNRPLLLSLGLLAGLGAGIAAALAIDRLDSSFHGIEDLRALGLPVAGGISLVAGGSAEAARRMRGQVAVAGSMVLLLLAAYGGLVLRSVSGIGLT